MVQCKKVIHQKRLIIIARICAFAYEKHKSDDAIIEQCSRKKLMRDIAVERNTQTACARLSADSFLFGEQARVERRYVWRARTKI